uniref:hypothetical protein n=1 Tax=Clostridioides difficile TaxID=1496 RepID=UPI0013042067
RQARRPLRQMCGTVVAIAALKWQRCENFTIKQMENTRNSLVARLDILLAAFNKYDVITFDQLGVARLFVVVRYAFLNLFLYTNMRNVPGLSTSDAQKSPDLSLQCPYIDELTAWRGMIFPPRTPASNSMNELSTVLSSLHYTTLQQSYLTHFASCA